MSNATSVHVVVAWGPRRLRVPVSPGTRLADVRDRACQQFGIETAKHALSHHGKPVDLTLPWRLSNLVPNAPLDLIRAPENSAPVRLKVRNPRTGQQYMGSFESSTTVKAVMDAAQVPEGYVLRLGDLELDSSVTLAGAGLSGALMVSMVPSSKPILTAALDSGQPPTTRASVKMPAQVPGLSSDTKTTPSVESVGQTPGVPPETDQKTDAKRPRSEIVRAPVDTPLQYRDEPPNELSPAQFMTYYHHLKAQAEPPLLTRDTRERLRQEKKRAIQKTVVRVRLPDQHMLEAEFGAEEVGAAVYAFVRRHLQRPEREFQLSSVSPSHILGTAENMITDCDFSGRVLLYLKFLEPVDSSEQLLNDEALAAAAKSAPPIQSSEPSSQTTVSHPPAPPEKKPDMSKHGVKVPKWLKLQK